MLPLRNEGRSAMTEKKVGKEVLRAVKFTLFSISAGIIQVLLTTIILDQIVRLKPYWLCYLIGLTASVIWNFTLNRQYTFQAANNIPIAMLKVAAFYAVFTPASTWVTGMLTDRARWPHLLVQLLVMLSNFVLEFLYDRFIVFGKSIDTNARAQKNAGRDDP